MSKNSSGKFSKTKGAGAALLAQLEGRGEKFNKDEVIAIGKTSSNQIVWLEQGRLNPKASGLAHIIDAHGHQFNGKGISNDEIPNYVLTAVTEGKIVRYQGRGTGRPIYEFTYNGSTHYVAVTIGNNGYIVGANPKSGI